MKTNFTKVCHVDLDAGWKLINLCKRNSAMDRILEGQLQKAQS